MKQIDIKDILGAVGRKNIEQAAKASLVLQEAQKFLSEKITQEFQWKPLTWKNGILRIAVEHSAGAHIIYGHTAETIEHLKTKFPTYDFREIRTEIQSRENF